jgi:hypothetical protein
MKAVAIRSSFSKSHLASSAAEVDQRTIAVAGPVEPIITPEDVEDASAPATRANALAVRSAPSAKAVARGAAFPSPAREHASTLALKPLQSANVGVVPSALDGGRLGRLMENRQ